MTTPNPYAVPTNFTVQLKPCCGEVLLGEQCDCDAFAAEAARMFERPLTLHTGPAAPDAAPSTTYPTSILYLPAGNGLLKRAETPR